MYNIYYTIIYSHVTCVLCIYNLLYELGFFMPLRDSSSVIMMRKRPHILLAIM